MLNCSIGWRSAIPILLLDVACDFVVELLPLLGLLGETSINLELVVVFPLVFVLDGIDYDGRVSYSLPDGL